MIHPLLSGRRLLRAITIPLLLLVAHTDGEAQPERPHPLFGVNSLSIDAGLGILSGKVADGLFRPVDSAVMLGSPGGIERSIGVRFSREMPDFFISRGATVHAGLRYIGFSISQEGTGRIPGTGDRPSFDLAQKTTLEADLLALSVGMRINTSKGRSRLMPTVDLGATFGHIFGLDVRNQTTPEAGYPEQGYVPDRRYYFNSIDLGLGLGVALGNPVGSPMIIPSLTLRATTTSLTKEPGEEVVPLSVLAGVEFRVPLGGGG